MVNYDRAKDPDYGLSEEEVRVSAEKHGENHLSRKKRKSLLVSFIDSFKDPMIRVLLMALVVNLIVQFGRSNRFESIGIAAAILLATLVSTLSEYGSESAFEKLREEASRIKCRVRRRDGVREIPVGEVVVGDIVLLQPGDRIPADGVILDGKLDVDQSALNGESKDAEKFRFSGVADADDFLNPSRLFSGSVVCAGEGFMRVTEVGDRTVYGKIGAELQEETRESPLRHRLGSLAKTIGGFGYAAALLCALTVLLNAVVLDNRFDTAKIIETLTTPHIIIGYLMNAATLAVTVIVMAVPEALPMMITVVLSANMRRMLSDNVLVRKLTGIETAGNIKVLFTDKTGTLTKGRPKVTHFVSGTGRVFSAGEQLDERLRILLRDSIIYNCSASMDNGVAIGGNATDRVLLEYAAGLGKGRRDIQKGKVVQPFTSESKYMATAVIGGWNATLVKGAPEKILPFCTSCYGESEAFSKLKIERAVEELSNRAARVIAIAVSENPTGGGVFRNLKLVGLVGMRDELRGEALEGIRKLTGAGIQPVMITGDALITAAAIARECGIVKNNRDLIMTSAELAELSDAELGIRFPNLRVVARALPSDKSRLVRVAQELGLVVGMTGDGVNDAPALKQADVGFAMGSGTEIAKEAGDIVILDDNLTSIAKAVCYGRTIFKSIRKFIIYQLSISMGAVGVTVIGPIIGVDLPITVVQMLWINLVMDTLAGLAFSGEAARNKYMEEPPKPRDEPIINAYMRGQITVNSVYTTALCLYFLKNPMIRRVFGSDGELYMLTAFFALFMFNAVFTSFCARTHEVNLIDYLSLNKAFIVIMGFVAVVQVLIIYYGGSVFRTVGLRVSDLCIVIFLAATIIPVDMVRKYLLSMSADYKGT